MKKNNLVYIISVFIFSASAVFYGATFLQAQDRTQNLSNVVWAVLPPDPFFDLKLSAKSALVIFPDTKEKIFTKNEEESLPLASITKLITTAIILEATDKKEKIAFAGDYFNRDELLSYMLVVSSNEVADAFFAHLKNKNKDPFKIFNTIKDKLNMRQVFILNPSGLDESDYQAGAYGSATDISKLLNYLYKIAPDILEATTKSHIKISGENGLVLEGDNTNKIIKDIPGFIGGKTGYTDLAGGNLAVLFEFGAGKKVAVVILGSQNKETRFTDVKQLINAFKEYVKYKTVDFENTH